MKKSLLLVWGAFGLICLHSSVHAVDRIRVMALFPNKAMVSVDGTNRLLNKGNPSPEGVLLVAADSREAVIEVDGRQRSYPLGEHIRSRFVAPLTREARIWRNDSGGYTTVGSVNGHSVDMLVDTGATTVSMSSLQAGRLGIRYHVDGRKIFVNTVSGRVTGYVVTLKRVKVGRIEMRDVDAIVVEGENPPAVLLGMSFLNRVTMQNKGKLLTLRIP